MLIGYVGAGVLAGAGVTLLLLAPRADTGGAHAALARCAPMAGTTTGVVCGVELLSLRTRSRGRRALHWRAHRRWRARSCARRRPTGWAARPARRTAGSGGRAGSAAARRARASRAAAAASPARRRGDGRHGRHGRVRRQPHRLVAVERGRRGQHRRRIRQRRVRAQQPDRHVARRRHAGPPVTRARRSRSTAHRRRARDSRPTAQPLWNYPTVPMTMLGLDQARRGGGRARRSRPRWRARTRTIAFQDFWLGLVNGKPALHDPLRRTSEGPDRRSRRRRRTRGRTSPAPTGSTATPRVYVNGVLAAIVQHRPGARPHPDRASWSAPPRLENSGVLDYFPGAIDDVRIYNRHAHAAAGHALSRSSR